MVQSAVSPSDAWGRLAPLVFLGIWSGGFIALKIGLQYADPLTFLALRYACVIVLLLPLLFWLQPSFPKTMKAWLALIGVGLFLQAGYFSFTYLSLYHGLSAGTVALIVNQQPILVGLLIPFMTQERVTSIRWIGLLLGVIGASIVIVSNSGASAGSATGVLFGLLALMSITGSTLVEKRCGAPTHPVTANLVQCGVGLLVSAPLSLAIEPMHVDWTWPLVSSLAYLVVGATILAITLLLTMIRRGEASRVSALFFMVPPTTALLAYIVLDEKLVLAAIPGMLLAVGGIFLVMREK